MKCNEIKELLSLYIDNMLEDGEREEMEKHLSACEACRKEYEEMKEMLSLLGQAETVPVPDEFSFRLKKALKEEKRNMNEAGILSGPSKKNRWRIISSIAAVFAVGVLSFGLYQDILGNLPGTLGGGEQTGADQAVEAYDMTGSGLAEAAKGTDIDSNSTSDGSVVMKERSAEPEASAKTFDTMMAAAPAENPPDQSSGAQNPVNDTKEQLSEQDLANSQNQANGTQEQKNSSQAVSNDLTGGLESNIGGGSAASDSVTGSGNTAPSPEDCSRSLPTTGVERNAAAVQYYNNLIAEKLKGFDYQVLSSNYTQTGEWQFRIFIFRGKDGNTYNEEITAIGKNGEIEIVCSNDFMGL